MGTIGCPLCCRHDFISVVALHDHLLYYMYRPLQCAVCSTHVGGIQELTHHLERHLGDSVSTATCPPKPVPEQNKEPGNTPFLESTNSVRYGVHNDNEDITNHRTREEPIELTLRAFFCQTCGAKVVGKDSYFLHIKQHISRPSNLTSENPLNSEVSQQETSSCGPSPSLVSTNTAALNILTDSETVTTEETHEATESPETHLSDCMEEEHVANQLLKLREWQLGKHGQRFRKHQLSFSSSPRTSNQSPAQEKLVNENPSSNIDPGSVEKLSLNDNNDLNTVDQTSVENEPQPSLLWPPSNGGGNAVISGKYSAASTSYTLLNSLEKVNDSSACFNNVLSPSISIPGEENETTFNDSEYVQLDDCAVTSLDGINEAFPVPSLSEENIERFPPLEYEILQGKEGTKPYCINNSQEGAKPTSVGCNLETSTEHIEFLSDPECLNSFKDSNQIFIQGGRDFSGNPNNNPIRDFSGNPNNNLVRDFSNNPKYNPVSEFLGNPNNNPVSDFSDNPNNNPGREFTDHSNNNPVRDLSDNPVKNPATDFLGNPNNNPVRDFLNNPNTNLVRDFSGNPDQNPVANFPDNPDQNPVIEFSDNHYQTPVTDFSDNPNNNPIREFSDNSNNDTIRDFSDNPTNNLDIDFSDNPNNNPVRNFSNNPTTTNNNPVRDFLGNPNNNSVKDFSVNPNIKANENISETQTENLPFLIDEEKRQSNTCEKSINNRPICEESLSDNIVVGGNPDQEPYLHKKFHHDQDRKIVHTTGISQNADVNRYIQSIQSLLVNKLNGTLNSDVPFKNEGMSLEVNNTTNNVNQDNNCSTQSEISPRVYICEVCNLKCSNRLGYAVHCKSHEVEGQKNFTCQFCSKKFFRKRSKDLHVRGHTGEKIHQCTVCSKIFTKLYALQRHKEEVHASGKHYVCAECSKEFSSQRQLQNHLDLHQSEKIHKCNQCDHACHTASGMRMHKLKIHSNDQKKEVYQCTVCKYNFKKHSGLKRHMQRKHSAAQLKCDLCPKMYSCNEDLLQHKKMHGSELFTCNHCEKTFTSSWNLQRHKVSHNKKTHPFQCDKCPAKFTRLDSLKSHLNIHSQKKPHVCHCGKRFGKKSQLKSHEDKHSAVPKYTCNICERSFKFKVSLKNHSCKKRYNTEESQHTSSS
ncbi:uncharacterized protein [Palaemon carinicauda]|uniref:uncharacterized protein n=1 Tax=Palaemon carinicauda TaxID=392227 RepID=UPI0035B5BC86